MPSRHSTLCERHFLVLRIELSGFEMYPCSRCELCKLTCIVLDNEDLKRCSKCACSSGKCNVEGILVSDWISLEREETRLNKEREVAMRAVEENIACVRCLERQQKFLKL